MSPEPNLVPNGLRRAKSDEVSCGSCAHFEEGTIGTYGTCKAFQHLVKPEYVCNSYTEKS